ncbi:hypothetical protein [Leisingera sp. JC11]|uniref:hypothetical protein n=1 Tax=Leisingera sp. JC11 TaxID=3042469 RepID=UPI0034531F58
MKKALHWLLHELRRGFPAFLFFFVAFHMITFTKAVAVADFSVSWFSASVATVGALTVAKAILIADNTAFAQAFSRWRISNILWKAFLFLIIATLFRMVEELLHAAVKHGGFRAGFEEFTATFSRPYFLALELWLILLLLLYCALTSMIRVIGREQVTELLFSSAGSEKPHHH